MTKSDMAGKILEKYYLASAGELVKPPRSRLKGLISSVKYMLASLDATANVQQEDDDATRRWPQVTFYSEVGHCGLPFPLNSYPDMRG